MASRRIRLSAETRAALAQVFAVARQPVWLVGGAIRNAALCLPYDDLDLACADARVLAAALARAFKATCVTLDKTSEVYRIMPAPMPGKFLKQIDIAGLQGVSIAVDLKRRDFTMNAVALPLTKHLPPSLLESSFLDPRGGLKDIAAGVIRADITKNLTDDPLRLLRAFRLSAQLGLRLEPKTLEAIAERCRLIKFPAPERVAAELLLLFSLPGASCWIKRLDEYGLLTAVFPELKPARRCAEDYYGSGGVLKHALEVCARVDFLLANLSQIYPDIAADLSAHIAARGGPSFRAALMLAALLHDVAKPETAKKIDGRLRFFEHDTKGAVAVEKILRRLRLSNALIDIVAAIVRHHLRPGHLAAGGPVTKRALYRFFRDLGTNAPGLLIVCWGDHASYMPEAALKRFLKSATTESKPSRLPADARKTVAHLKIVSTLLRRWRDLERAPKPSRLLDGREIMKALKIPPGPRIGELLERVREAQAEGKIKDRAQALAFIASPHVRGKTRLRN